LAIDNLGNGQSDHPDPISVVQGPLQITIIQKIMAELRNGTVPSVPKYEKVIFASHSYGSILGRLITQFFPTTGADAYILTATSNNLTGLKGFIAETRSQSASAIKGKQFAHLPPAYQAVAPSSVRDVLYPADGDFDPRMLQVDISQPHIFAVGEIAAPGNPVVTNFTGPVLVVTGREDQIVCGNGNITSNPDCGVGPGSNPDGTRILFPKASRFDAFIPDRSAHVVNSQYSAPEAFGTAHAWLQSVGF
jgi:pimeloyl-ACP methyl ester carboxylesterase